MQKYMHISFLNKGFLWNVKYKFVKKKAADWGEWWPDVVYTRYQIGVHKQRQNILVFAYAHLVSGAHKKFRH
jgi:hypothetical protein